MNPNWMDEKLALYFRPENTEVFLVGRLLQRSRENLVLLRLMGDRGEPDGWLLAKLDSFYRLEWDSAYLWELGDLGPEARLPEEADPWETILQYAETAGAAVQLLGSRNQRMISGRVLDHTGDRVTIQAIRKDGTTGRTAAFRRTAIRFLFCGTESEKALLRRWEENQYEK